MTAIWAMARTVGWASAGIMLATAVIRAGVEILRDSTETDGARVLITVVVLAAALTLFLWGVGKGLAASRDWARRERADGEDVKL